MGKGQIVSSLGDGKYTVTLQMNRERAESSIADMQYEIAVLNTETIPALSADVVDTGNGLDTASATQNAAIESGDASAISAATTAYREAMTAYRQALSRLRRALASKVSMQTRINTLQSSLHEDVTVDAWCADLTTDLSGTVATMEIPGERQRVLIRPGYEGRAGWSGSEHGQLTPILSTTPAATFYNLAMLPGWQKWMPTYRTGTVSDVDEATDTCTVTLDGEVSSTGFVVGDGRTMRAVPIEYMDCNAEAFSDGDHIVVEFVGQDPGDPLVIGFVDNPMACPGDTPMACPLYVELKFTSAGEAIQWYFIVDSMHHASGFIDLTGDAPDGPCEGNHDHFTTGDPMPGIGQTPWFVVNAVAGQEFTWRAYPYIPQMWTFCAAWPGHPIADAGVPRDIGPFDTISYDEWLADIIDINTQVNLHCIYEDDPDDEWQVIACPGGRGDCEDFALTKMQMLADAGVPAGAMDIVLCKYDGAGHAIAAIMTDNGLRYLDGSSNRPQTADEMEHISDITLISRTIGEYAMVPIESESQWEDSEHIPPGTINGEVIDATTIRILDTPARFAYSSPGKQCTTLTFNSPYAALVQIQVKGHVEWFEIEDPPGSGEYIWVPEVTIYLGFYVVIHRSIPGSFHGFEYIDSEPITTHVIELTRSGSHLDFDDEDFAVGPWTAYLRHSDCPDINPDATWPFWAIYGFNNLTPLGGGQDSLDDDPGFFHPGRRHGTWYEPCAPDEYPLPWRTYTLVGDTIEHEGFEYTVEPFAITINKTNDISAAFESFSVFNAT
jgi:predicted transglutaminase-like cysteine proteinase